MLWPSHIRIGALDGTNKETFREIALESEYSMLRKCNCGVKYNTNTRRPHHDPIKFLLYNYIALYPILHYMYLSKLLLWKGWLWMKREVLILWQLLLRGWNPNRRTRRLHFLIKLNHFWNRFLPPLIDALVWMKVCNIIEFPCCHRCAVSLSLSLAARVRGWFGKPCSSS